MKDLVESSGVKVAFNEVDVVTTGTQGAMCSSGAVINVGHSDPPIKIDKAWINDVPIPHPGAAVDLFIGATIASETRGFEYGGAHVIEDLIAGKEVDFRAPPMVRIVIQGPSCRLPSPRMISTSSYCLISGTVTSDTAAQPMGETR